MVTLFQAFKPLPCWVWWHIPEIPSLGRTGRRIRSLRSTSATKWVRGRPELNETLLQHSHTLKNTLYLLNIYWFVPFPYEAVIWAFCLKCTFVTIGKNCSTFSPSPHFYLCHTSNLISFQDSNDKRLQSPECLWTCATNFVVVQDGEITNTSINVWGKARKMIGLTAPHGFTLPWN